MPLRLPLAVPFLAALACTGAESPEPPPPALVVEELPPLTAPPAPLGPPLLEEPEEPEETRPTLRITHRAPADQRGDMSTKATRQLRRRARAMGYEGVEQVVISTPRCSQRDCTVVASGLAIPR